MAYLDPEFETLPDGWTAKQLSEVVEIHNTKRQPLNGREREGRRGEYPYCGANGVVDHIDDYRFDGEFVLIAEDGGYWGKHQQSSYIMRGKFWVNNHAHVVCAIPTKTTNTFFSNIVNYLNIDPFIGGDARGKLTKAIITQLAIPLPPLPEQKKIAHILSTVQRAIEAQERIIQTTTELKKALMHKLFTEGLRNEPQKQTEIGPIPESWEVVELGKVARIERGKFSHRPRNEPRFYGGEYPFVQTGDVSNCDGYVRTYTQTLNEEGLAISKMFPSGTILITIAANIGFTGILKFDSACPDSLIGISPLEGVYTDFLNYYLITQQPKMDRLAPKGTQKNINIQFLKPWPVPLPSIEEQKEIAGTFSAADRKIKLATQKRNQLQDLFRTLLHELMTAKIRVHDIDVTGKSARAKMVGEAIA